MALSLLFALTGLAQCESWEEAPPATPASAPLGAPLPPESAIHAPGAASGVEDVEGSSAPSRADLDPKYASDEYAIGADTDSYDDRDASALNDFRAPLEPFGTWADDSTYGTVWLPSPSAVGAGFRPYVSAGHWAYDDDYVWVSDYSWGWAPFHYGRWVFVEGRGWAWIPGREYRGAWVTWSVDDGYSYLGWAPMGPAFVWFGGVPVGWNGYWGPRWAYVPRGDVFAPRVGARVVVGPSAVAIAGRMRPYTVTETHVGGPPPTRFGYSAAQIPRVSGAAAVGVTRAQQFARPSTARPLGASLPARIQTRSSSVGDGRVPLVGPRPAISNSSAPRGGAPGLSNVPRSNAVVVPNAGRAPAAPVFHPSGAFHGSGGHHR